MRTLTYGRQVPETSDPGETWFPALEDNISRDDVHDHDGDNSPVLTGVLAVSLTTQSILSASWVSLGDGSGLYSQVVTLPAVDTHQLQYDEVSIEFRLSSGTRVYPTVTKTSATTYTIYVNDNSLALTALYTT